MRIHQHAVLLYHIIDQSTHPSLADILELGLTAALSPPCIGQPPAPPVLIRLLPLDIAPIHELHSSSVGPDPGLSACCARSLGPVLCACARAGVGAADQTNVVIVAVVAI